MEDKRKRPGIITQFKIAAQAFVTQLTWGDVPSAYAAYVSNTVNTTTYNYEASVGNGFNNSIVRSCVEFIARAFPEAPLQVKSVKKTGETEIVHGHPLSELIKRPNNAYTGTKLWQGTIQDWMLNGNAYWVKVRNRQGGVVQVWWVPSFLIAPVPGTKPGILVDYYLYRPNPREDPIAIPVEDVVHFRNGLDPATGGRIGLSPIAAVLREIFTDDEAANYTAAMMRNIGIPGLIISPDTGDIDISQEEADRLKNEVKLRTTGDNRGDPIVVSARMKIDKLAFSPEQMNVRELRRIPEERIAAQFGIPPVVLNLGAGLDRCLTGDTRIWTPSGSIRVDEISVGTEVWAIEDGKIVKSFVTNWANNGVKPVYEVRTKNRIIRTTDNHKFLARIPGNSKGSNSERHSHVEMAELKSLKIGDRLVQPISLPEQNGHLLPDGELATKEMMMFLGALIGDGTVTNTCIIMSMPANDRCGLFYREISKKLFLHSKKIGEPVHITEDKRSFRFSGVKIASRLSSWGFNGRAHTKRIPAWVYGLSNELKLSFLAGLVDSDGTIDKRGVLKFGMCNHNLVEDIRDLLISCGIQCSNISYFSVNGSRLPNPGLYESYDSWEFVASSAVQVSKIPFSDQKYRERVEDNPLREKVTKFDSVKAGLNDELGFYKIISINYSGEQETFDVEINSDQHCMIANGILLSNSTFGNYNEARKAAYESNLIPLQRDFADQISLQLLPDFEGDSSKNFHVEFDFGRMRIMQEDQDKLYERVGKGVLGSYMTVNEARSLVGLPPLDGGDVLLVTEKSSFINAEGDLAPTMDPSQQAFAAIHDKLHADDNSLENTGPDPALTGDGLNNSHGALPGGVPEPNPTGTSPENNISGSSNPVKYLNIPLSALPSGFIINGALNGKNGNGVTHTATK